ncbi:MAG: serine/threonine-protein kinase [Gemmataceae bacterium]
MPDDRTNADPAQLKATVMQSPTERVRSGLRSGGPGELPARFGRYILLKLLGKGGMGAVYLAHDGQLDRVVALKMPHFDGPDRYQLHDRFLREAQVAATLHHPNLCPVYDVGEVEGTLYLTMAFLEGKPLARFIKPGQKLPTRAVATVVRQLALAMQEAHDSGVIHRDLKPSNIMVTPDKRPVIMDFGLARRTDGNDPQLTVSGMLMGTPTYMPPEQINSDHTAVGPASDIYSLGVILYELLAGQPPFSGPLGTLMSQIMTEQPPPLSASRTDLSPALSAICSKALAKKPEDRFASMREFAEALRGFLRGTYSVRDPEEDEPIYTLAQEAIPLEAHDAASLFQVMARPARTVQTRRRRRRFRMPEWIVPLILGSGALAAFVLILRYGYQLLDRRRPSPTLDASSEQPRLRERQKLEAALSAWRAEPGPNAELDGWLDTPSGRRLDLPSEVNAALGRYQILERDQWAEGVRRLLLSDNTPWRRAAEAEVMAATSGDPAAELACGDAWWIVAESLPGGSRAKVRSHAAEWYRRALPKLDGSDAQRAKERT